MLVLAGGRGWKAEETYRLAAETLPGQIVLTGYISAAEKRLIYQHAEMFSYRYFRAYRFDITKRVHLSSDYQSFQHILFVEGHGVLRHQEREIAFRKGNSFFIPAALGDYSIEGNCRMLLSHV